MLCSGSASPCPKEPWGRAGSELSLLLVPEAPEIIASTIISVLLDSLQGKGDPSGPGGASAESLQFTGVREEVAVATVLGHQGWSDL